jgi:hypothetical protein
MENKNRKQARSQSGEEFTLALIVARFTNMLQSPPEFRCEE